MQALNAPVQVPQLMLPDEICQMMKNIPAMNKKDVCEMRKNIPTMLAAAGLSSTMLTPELRPDSKQWSDVCRSVTRFQDAGCCKWFDYPLLELKPLSSRISNGMKEEHEMTEKEKEKTEKSRKKYFSSEFEFWSHMLTWCVVTVVVTPLSFSDCLNHMMRCCQYAKNSSRPALASAVQYHNAMMKIISSKNLNEDDELRAEFAKFSDEAEQACKVDAGSKSNSGYQGGKDADNGKGRSDRRNYRGKSRDHGKGRRSRSRGKGRRSRSRTRSRGRRDNRCADKNRDRDNRYADKKCFKCGELGHIAAVCKKNDNGEDKDKNGKNKGRGKRGKSPA